MPLSSSKFLLFVFLFVACGDWNPEVELPQEKGIPVVSGFLKVGEEISFSIFQSTSPLDAHLKNEQGNLKLSINDLQYALLMDSNSYSNPSKISELDTIELIGEVDGQFFESIDICPIGLKKENVSFYQADKNRIQITLKKQQVENYYQLEVFETWMEYETEVGGVYYDSIVRRIPINFSSNNLFFDNPRPINNLGQDYRIFHWNREQNEDLDFTISLNNVLDKAAKHKNLFREVILRKISNNHYNFLFSISQNTYRYGDVLSLPINAFTNVKNGLGMFCCYAEIRDTIE